MKYQEYICPSCGNRFSEHSNVKLSLCLKIIEIVNRPDFVVVTKKTKEKDGLPK